MTVEAIIAIAVAAVDSLLKLISTLGGQLNEQDIAKLKFEVVEAMRDRADAIEAQEAREWAIVRGEQP